MKATKRIIGACLALAAMTTLPAVHAAYPLYLDVTVEVLNEGQQHLVMTHASWVDNAAMLDEYKLADEDGEHRFDVRLSNPYTDFATFRYASAGGKVCEFGLAHKTKFSWRGIERKSEKSATAQSVGNLAAQCSAMVTKGGDSVSNYSVRFSMR